MRFGYVEFENKETVDKVLNMPEIILRGKVVILSRFAPKTAKSKNESNLLENNKCTQGVPAQKSDDEICSYDYKRDFDNNTPSTMMPEFGSNKISEKSVQIQPRDSVEYQIEDFQASEPPESYENYNFVQQTYQTPTPHYELVYDARDPNWNSNQQYTPQYYYEIPNQNYYRTTNEVYPSSYYNSSPGFQAQVEPQQYYPISHQNQAYQGQEIIDAGLCQELQLYNTQNGEIANPAPGNYSDNGYYASDGYYYYYDVDSNQGNVEPNMGGTSTSQTQDCVAVEYLQGNYGNLY